MGRGVNGADETTHPGQMQREGRLDGVDFTCNMLYKIERECNTVFVMHKCTLYEMRYTGIHACMAMI